MAIDYQATIAPGAIWQRKPGGPRVKIIGIETDTAEVYFEHFPPNGSGTHRDSLNSFTLAHEFMQARQSV